MSAYPVVLARAEESPPDSPPARAYGWAQPALVYLGGQLLTLWLVNMVARAHHRSMLDLLTSWDGAHFISIADQGYNHTVASGQWRSPAFFPGYPGAIAGVNYIVGNLTASALLISAVAGVATSYGLVRLYPLATGRLGDHRAALILVALFATSPLAVVYSMAYSEALFCALAVWALVAILERHWLSAGALICVAGSVRQTAVALCAALAIAAVVDAWRGRGDPRAFTAVLLAPLGMLSYLLWVDHVTGVSGGWFKAERNGWNSRFDAGHATAVFAYHAIVDARAVLDVVTVGVLAAGIVSVAAMVRSHIAPPVISYGAVVLGLDALSDGVMNSKVRILLPAFVLLIPLATQITREWSRGGRLRIAVFAAFGIWYSAYGLIMYGYAI